MPETQPLTSLELQASTEPRTSAALRGLIVDWGGVLTAPLDDTMTEWARVEGIDFALFREVMTDWIGSAGTGPAISGGSVETAKPGEQPGGEPGGEPGEQPGGDPGEPTAELDDVALGAAGARLNTPVHALERGELASEEFERVLSDALRAKGADVPADGLLSRMLGGLADTRDDMVNLVRRARGSGLRTAMLSNSWGEHYPEHAWVGAFDAVVISGRVGMRKPDADIYLHTARLLDLPPDACVFVDDAQRNIVGAVAVGMVGVLHESYEKTLTELEVLFDRLLA